jgi:phage N-6-adenine-methyltransferase
MPVQKPGRSVQVVGTPRDLLNAVEKRFGPITLDLAANRENRVCENFFGPGTHLVGGEDSLAPNVSWRGLSLRWINPEFSDIDPWAAKCAAERHHAFIAMLTPASVGADWFREHVHQKAMVLFLSPRITFVGHTQPYPKDCILSVFGPFVAPGYDCWRWKP